MADGTVSFEHVEPATCWEAAEAGEAAISLTERAQARLIDGLRRGDDAAYEELLSLYEKPVYNLVYRLLANPADAPDVVQEVFLKVFRNITAFRAQSSLKTWIYRIAVNEAHNHRRWFERKCGQEVGLEEEVSEGIHFHQVLEDQERSPFESFANAEARAMIEDALQSLKPAFRSAVVLRDVEELSYDEIADILQANLGTVKSRILRGREALRVALEVRMQARRGSDLRWCAAE
ncbi:MAG: sigma-70 family RNA polymerase sigma factor [Bryobacterales bacterium]|nr:sigma-70 family RNA polymerase sigma factor [Bryobacterales bacterium]